MKICSKCKTNKEDREFGSRKNRPSGLKSWCRDCENKGRRQRLLDPEAREHSRRQQKEHKSDPEVRARNDKQHSLYISRPEISRHIADMKKKRRSKPEVKKREAENRKRYRKERRERDPIFRLKERLGSLIRASLKGKGSYKKNKDE